MSGKFGPVPAFYARQEQQEQYKNEVLESVSDERNRLIESKYWEGQTTRVVVPVPRQPEPYRPDYETIFSTTKELQELVSSIDQESADNLTRQLCVVLKDACTEMNKLATYCRAATQAAIEAKKALADV